MAHVIKTHLRHPSHFNYMEREWIYNGLDCCVTAEVLAALLPQLDATTSATYDFSRALQAPVMEMRTRGVLVDQAQRARVISETQDTIDRLERQLDRLVYEGLELQSFNWHSTNDLRHLFHVALHLPAITRGEGVSVDRAAREKLAAKWVIARPFVNHINALWDLGKKLQVLQSGIDADGRVRTSYNITGTYTGRFSSSLSEFGTGGNLQNIEESIRSIFIADPGYKFAKFDAKSGESYVVGALEWNLFEDSRYLDVCESGDPHTAVARICWPDLGWKGNLYADKALAETPYYRHHTYRFMCKKLGHGSNYGGQARTLAEQAKMDLGVVSDFQVKYFRAFPAHIRWRAWTEAELRRTGKLTSLMGRRCQFWGRRNDDETLRKAMAYNPQSSLADIVNRAMLREWRRQRATIVFQDHDALTWTYPISQEADIVPAILAAMPEDVPLTNGRVLRIPYDCKVGWNRADYSATNPLGLREWTGHDERRAAA